MHPTKLRLACLTALLCAAPASAQIGSWSTPGGSGPPVNGRDFTLSAGLSMPTGNFGSHTGLESGFAKPGVSLGLDLTNRYDNNIEAGIALWLDANPTDSDALTEVLNGRVRSVFTGTDPYNVRAANWYSGWAMAKVGFSKPTARMHRPYVDLLGGLLVLRSPSIALSTFGAAGSAAFPSPGRTYVGPAWGAGVGVRVRNRIAVGLQYRAAYIEQLNPAQESAPRGTVDTFQLSLGHISQLSDRSER